MRKRKQGYDQAWFERLDAIIEGSDVTTAEDDEILHVAAKLSRAFASFEDRPAPQRSVQGLCKQRQPVLPRLGVSQRRRMISRRLLATVVALILFGLGQTCVAAPQVAATTLRTGQQLWQAATAFEEINASSVALLALKKKGVRPLLPVKVPVGTQAIEFGMIVDTADPRNFMAFVADYRLDRQDISVYEQTADLLLPSSLAQQVTVHASKAQLFEDEAGNHLLQWYQDGMTCQMASTLPAGELLAIAQQFQPIANWEYIL